MGFFINEVILVMSQYEVWVDQNRPVSAVRASSALRDVALSQRFSVFIVLQPLDDISIVAATPNNRTDWVTSNEHIIA